MISSNSGSEFRGLTFCWWIVVVCMLLKAPCWGTCIRMLRIVYLRLYQAEFCCLELGWLRTLSDSVVEFLPYNLVIVGRSSVLLWFWLRTFKYCVCDELSWWVNWPIRFLHLQRLFHGWLLWNYCIVTNFWNIVFAPLYNLFWHCLNKVQIH